MKKFLVAAVAALSIASSAQAVPVFATSYGMPNGDGQTSGGTFNYWDKEYTGAGSTITDGAALSGGLGNLTDGVIATDFWFNVENNAGTGPFVGWRATNTLNPIVTFTFAGSPAVDQVIVHIDDSGAGGVFAPAAIWIDGVNTTYTPPATGSLLAVDLSGLTLTGNQHTIQFFQTSGTSWIFVSEIQFFANGVTVPEPASWALVLTGLGLFGVAAGRRRQTVRGGSSRIT